MANLFNIFYIITQTIKYTDNKSMIPQDYHAIIKQCLLDRGQPGSITLNQLEEHMSDFASNSLQLGRVVDYAHGATPVSIINKQL